MFVVKTQFAILITVIKPPWRAYKNRTQIKDILTRKFPITEIFLGQVSTCFKTWTLTVFYVRSDKTWYITGNWLSAGNKRVWCSCLHQIETCQYLVIKVAENLRKKLVHSFPIHRLSVEKWCIGNEWVKDVINPYKYLLKKAEQAIYCCFGWRNLFFCTILQ